MRGVAGAALAVVLAAHAAEASAVERNWARGKPAHQSSTTFGGDAARAVDGNRDGIFATGSVTHTADEVDPYWEIDLGAAYRISEVRVFNRTDCCQERLRNFAVFYVNNKVGFLHRSFADTLAQNASNPALNVGARAVFFPSGIIVDRRTGQTVPGAAVSLGGDWARFIRVQIAGPGTLSIAEVEVVERVDIDGPDGFADATEWRDTERRTPAGATAVSLGRRVGLFNRGADGLLRYSVDFGAELIVPWSPLLAGGPVGATLAPDPRQVHVAVRAGADRGRRQPGPLWVLDADVETRTDQLTSPRWQELGVTDAPPAIIAACDKIIVAWRRGTAVYTRWRLADKAAAWSAPQRHPSSRSMPTLAVNANNLVGLAFIGGQGSVTVRQANCGAATLDWFSNAPYGREAAGEQVTIAGWGPLFAVGILGTDQRSYFSVQARLASTTWTPFEPIGSTSGRHGVAGAPRLVVFSGAIIALIHFDDRSLGYWVRSPNSIAPSAGWVGGTLLGPAGIAADPPSFAAVGQSQVFGITGAPAEIFAVTRNVVSNHAAAINLGRAVAYDLLTHVFRVAATAHRDIDPQPDRGADLTLVPNLFEHMVALLSLPRDAWPAVASKSCGGLAQPTLLKLDPQAIGTTRSRACPMWTLQNSSISGQLDGLMHEWMHLDYAQRDVHSWPDFDTTFQFDDGSDNPADSGMRACERNADCGSNDVCETAGNTRGGTADSTQRFAPAETSLRRWDNRLVCVSSVNGPSGRRYQGGVDWYDIGTSDHAFINTATLYRWFGDDLRDLVAADQRAGNDQLKKRYDWLRDRYFGGIEFNGRAGPADRNLGTWGFPNR